MKYFSNILGKLVFIGLHVTKYCYKIFFVIYCFYYYFFQRIKTMIKRDKMK